MTLCNGVCPLTTHQEQRRIRIRALNAVSQFRASKFDAAIDTFIELDFNPAKVVALYPEAVSGRLFVPQERWIPLYGGPVPVDDDHAASESSHDSGSKPAGHVHERTATEIFDTLAPGGSGSGSVGGRLRRTGLGMFLPSGHQEDDTASISSKKKPTLHGVSITLFRLWLSDSPPSDDLNRSVETLVRYLADRRPKLHAALVSVNITPESQSHVASPLSEASIEELFALPNAPLSALTPEQLLRFAQIVDTALYKSYLIIRPALLGSLCRVANWCEVSEVEEDLRARKVWFSLFSG